MELPVKRGDPGEYALAATATGRSGKDSATVRVTVTVKPEKPEGPLQISGTGANWNGWP